MLKVVILICMAAQQPCTEENALRRYTIPLVTELPNACLMRGNEELGKMDGTWDYKTQTAILLCKRR